MIDGTQIVQSDEGDTYVHTDSGTDVIGEGNTALVETPEADNDN